MVKLSRSHSSGGFVSSPIGDVARRELALALLLGCLYHSGGLVVQLAIKLFASFVSLW